MTEEHNEEPRQWEAASPYSRPDILLILLRVIALTAVLAAIYAASNLFRIGRTRAVVRQRVHTDFDQSASSSSESPIGPVE